MLDFFFFPMVQLYDICEIRNSQSVYQRSLESFEGLFVVISDWKSSVTLVVISTILMLVEQLL